MWLLNFSTTLCNWWTCWNHFTIVTQGSELSCRILMIFALRPGYVFVFWHSEVISRISVFFSALWSHSFPFSLKFRVVIIIQTGWIESLSSLQYREWSANRTVMRMWRFVKLHRFLERIASRHRSTSGLVSLSILQSWQRYWIQVSNWLWGLRPTNPFSIHSVINHRSRRTIQKSF